MQSVELEPSEETTELLLLVLLLLLSLLLFSFEPTVDVAATLDVVAEPDSLLLLLPFLLFLPDPESLEPEPDLLELLSLPLLFVLLEESLLELPSSEPDPELSVSLLEPEPLSELGFPSSVTVNYERNLLVQILKERE